MRILVSGAGVAGLATAVALGSQGHDVTVVERATQFRTKGAPIDIRGDALEVADRWGILPDLRERSVAMSENAVFVDSEGTAMAPMGGASFHETDDDIEIPREDVCEVLARALPRSVSVRFAESVRTLTDTGGGVEATFTSGGSEHYDIVVGADGLHSLTRRLVFGPEQDYVQHLGYYFGYSWHPADDLAEDGGALLSWPGHLVGKLAYRGSTGVMVQFRSDRIEYDRHSIDEQRQILQDAFGDRDEWKVPEILDLLLSDPDLYFDAVSRVVMDSWHRGSIVLVGDAAHCASPLSGRGTSLALTGAEHLAAALREHPEDLEHALTVYETTQRPAVSRAHHLARDGGERLVPSTREGIEQRDAQLSGS